MPSPTTVRVLISYSHDSVEHTRRVRALADRLRTDGVEAWIDQYVQDPEEGWPNWMRSQVEQADRVLLVFTETYQRRFEGNEGEGKGLGATFEGVIVTQWLYESGGRNVKFRPVVFREEDARFIPVELRRFNLYRVDTPENYKALLRWLHGVPRIVVPAVGQKPYLPPEPSSELFQSGQSRQARTRVVDAFCGGDHLTLADALAAAEPGDRILVRPGAYREGIIVDKRVEIIGGGDLGRVVVEATDKDVVLFNADQGRVVNLALRQIGGKGVCCGVNILRGRLELEGCDITSQSGACVAIRGGATPWLRGNRIHDGNEAGVYVYDNGCGILEENEIFSNSSAGVEITRGGNPVLKRNAIHHCNQTGIRVYGHGQGTFEDNDIFSNGIAGIAIGAHSNAIVKGNRIHDGKELGIYVLDGGQGILEDNKILGNALAGVDIRTAGYPLLRRNRISKNGYEGILVHQGGGGVFQDNNLSANGRGAWRISADCLNKVTQERNLE